MAQQRRRGQFGTSMVEMLTVASIAAVLVGAAAPNLIDLRDRQRLLSLTSAVETDLQQARSLAVSLNQVLRMSFGTGAGQGCYVLHTGSNAQQCRCGEQPGDSVCTGDAVALRSVTLAADQGVQLLANVSAMAFEPHRGTVTPAGTVRVQQQDGRSVRLVVNIMGRVRACTPHGLVGWAAC